MGDQQKAHILLISFPVQGHINPALQFGNRLLRAGAEVTFAINGSGYGLLDKTNVPYGINFATFEDKSLCDVLDKLRTEGKPVTSLVYTLLLHWAAEVARDYHVPSALLWIQPAFMFNLYYYYFKGYGDEIRECGKDPLWCLQLPNMSFRLMARDLPSILIPSTPSSHDFLLPMFQEQIQVLVMEETPTILVNTYEELEVDALKAIKELKLIPVGPLFPLTRPSAKVEEEEDYYMTWLNSKEESSVIYVSFGSIALLSRQQQLELACALLLTHMPFLWVIRAKENKNQDKVDDEDENDEVNCMLEDLKHQGIIVPWCSQVEVLSHPSIGCFITHCGWNSTLESITCGVPMVAFPQWLDQNTNAKLIQDVWKIGVRVEKSEGEELVKQSEITRCLELVMGNQEMKENAKRWKQLASQASQDDGSSNKNINDYIHMITSNQK